MRIKFSTLADRCRMLQLALLLAMLSASTMVLAAEVKDLFSVEVPVHGQADAERQQAIRDGLATVLIKVSGRRDTPTMPAMVAVLETPMNFVQQFRYHDLPEQWQQVVDDQGQFYSQLLRVSYDGQAVSRVLREASLPVWGRARPSTLIWLAVEDWNQRSILGSDNLPALREVISRQASQRGLPLVFPLLDLQDQASLGFADIWGDFQDDILKASSRYQAGSVLVGRLYRQSANEWQARWTMYQQDEVQRWVTEGLQQQQVVVEGLDVAVDHFAERFARLPTGTVDSRVAVIVKDVTSLAAYARVMSYLEALDLAKEVVVEQVTVDRVTFSLTIRGELQRLEQAIVFGDTLAPVTVIDSVVVAEINSSETVSTETSSVPDAVPDRPVLSYRLLP
jgi:hypothetical protein